MNSSNIDNDDEVMDVDNDIPHQILLDKGHNIG
jgi:hypothetical protein